MHRKSAEFIEAVDQNQTQAAFALLSQDAQSKVDYGQFARTGNDFRGIVDSFRQAGISARSDEELAIYVQNLDGQEGVVRFVMVQEAGEWRIANVLAEG